MPYDPSIPTPKDEVRLLVGDVTNEELMTDQEIEFFIERYTGLKRAAGNVALAIAAKAARNTDFRFSTLWQSASQAYEHFTILGERLIAEASSEQSGGPVFVYEGDEPRPPLFDIGMHDNRT